MQVTRRRFMRNAAGATFAATGSNWLSRAVAANCEPRDFRVALSVSPFTESVLASVALTDGEMTAKSVREVQLLFNRHGATEIYQRIAGRKRSPQGPAEHGWERGLERARLARDLNMPFNPEIGIFANYGDVANYQEPPDFSDYPSIRLPAPWITLKLEQMLPPLREYGALIARQILNAGARVNVWDLGNEVEAGIAGVVVRPMVPTKNYQPPDAVDPEVGRRSLLDLINMSEADRISWSRAHLWPHVARLLGAVAEGIRSVDKQARFSTHISGLAQRTAAVPSAFWATMKEHGYLPDELGHSFWGTEGPSMYGPADKLGWLRDTATELHSKFGRPLFLAEYGFPSAQMQAPFKWNDAQAGYGQSEQGQFEFTRDVVAWGMQTGRLSGVRPWAPDFCTQGVWGPMSWFSNGASLAKAKPVLRAFTAARSKETSLSENECRGTSGRKY